MLIVYENYSFYVIDLLFDNLFKKLNVKNYTERNDLICDREV